MNNYEVVQFVKTRLDAGNKTLSQICEEVSGDMTIELIYLMFNGFFF